MAKNNKMPAIRFSGYTDTWEQRKFDEIMTFINGRAYKQDELLSDGKYKVLRVGNFYTNDSWYYSNLELDDKYYAMNGDLLYTWSATFGPHIWKGEKVIYHYHIWKIVLKNKIDKLFALQLLEVDKANIMSDKNGSTMVHITKQGMENKKTILPLSLNEQKQISKFLSSIDKLITLHQRKLEKLKLTKKALLQKLFPQNGSKFPELRFKGFTAAWEQCKLSDITEIVMGQSPSSKNYTDNPNDNILVQGNADLKDGKVVPRLWTKEITKTIDKDGIVLTVRAPVGDVAKTDYKVVLGRGVAGIKGNDYIYQFLQKLQNNRYWVSLSSGSTFESINSNDIKDLIIDIPSIEEQTKISMLLNNVNSIITLHQRKLEMLKNVKKGLLQKMFV